ncbi:AraC family transcriptional regulator [Achromobacter marplatensis]|uniref:AraC family transcriptional regulator n=1 Tax=Achromobacter marplatensis TaxID=470868 RepID=A0ABX9GJB4_9BURK|nr:AraC family transcriptional regulator [Achromobacter marplatensis]OWT72089.1 AraC family transcriptional regulator [Achromobacter marplatensis]RBP24642.1 AraC family transcriptional regulator [Achromobacter marplatensis]CAB3625437.1 HTH-type transcriptional activator RhaS [Achromobacter marplatensis]
MRSDSAASAEPGAPVLTGVPAAFDHPNDRAEFRHAAYQPGVELYRADIVRHAFEPHTHEAYGLGAIESGVERFRYRGAEHLAPSGSVVLMNPDELHTGQAETETGWRYRMAYIDPDVVARVTGESDWWFDTAVGHDSACAQRVTALLDTLWQAREPLAFDSALYTLLGEFRRHAQVPRAAPDEGALRFAPVIDYLRAHLSRRLTLDELAAVAGLSPFHFLRRFQAQHHATPQQMLMALRLFEAKRLLAAGIEPAQVALAAGLTDQAHLTRAFSRRYGVTPARYQKQVRG